MTPNTKEWIVNGVLLAGILGFLALIGTGQFASLDEEGSSNGTPAQTPTPRPRPAGPVATVYNPLPGQTDPFPLIGETEMFRELITPSPSPTPPPPPAAQTPSLQRAVKNWQYQYPIKRFNAYHFLDKATNKEYDIKETEPLPVPDPVTRQDVQVKAKPSGKAKVILESPDGQTVEFSL